MNLPKNIKSIKAKLNLFLSISPYRRTFSNGKSYKVVEYGNDHLIVKDDDGVHHILSGDYLNKNFTLNF